MIVYLNKVYLHAPRTYKKVILLNVWGIFSPRPYTDFFICHSFFVHNVILQLPTYFFTFICFFSTLSDLKSGKIKMHAHIPLCLKMSAHRFLLPTLQITPMTSHPPMNSKKEELAGYLRFYCVCIHKYKRGGKSE